MDPVSFAVGALVGIVATCAGSTLIVWRMVRRAPRLEYDRDGEARTLYVLPGQAHPVDEVNDYWRSVGHVRTTTDPPPARWLGPDEITFERGPVTYYPPGTPPLIEANVVEPLPGLRFPRCEYIAMQRRCCQTLDHLGHHMLKAERTLTPPEYPRA